MLDDGKQLIVPSIGSAIKARRAKQAAKWE